MRAAPSRTRTTHDVTVLHPEYRAREDRDARPQGRRERSSSTPTRSGTPVIRRCSTSPSTTTWSAMSATSRRSRSVGAANSRPRSRWAPPPSPTSPRPVAPTASAGFVSDDASVTVTVVAGEASGNGTGSGSPFTGSEAGVLGGVDGRPRSPRVDRPGDLTETIRRQGLRTPSTSTTATWARRSLPKVHPTVPRFRLARSGGFLHNLTPPNGLPRTSRRRAGDTPFGVPRSGRVIRRGAPRSRGGRGWEPAVHRAHAPARAGSPHR